MKQNSTELAPRKAPSQRRSQQRVESILDATAKLLDEIGPDGVNTNSIADAAGIPVSSLYQYFPNKHSVLAAVAERHMSKVARHANDFLSKRDPSSHWSAWLDDMIEMLTEVSMESPGVGPLWNFMRAHPKLYDDVLKEILTNQLAIIPTIINFYRQSRGAQALGEDDAQQLLLLMLECTIPLICTTSAMKDDDPARGIRRQATRDVLFGLAKPYMVD